MKGLKRIECRDSGATVVIQTSTGPYFLNKENIRIKARSKRDRTLCWYYHPIFKKLSYVEYRMIDGRPEFFLSVDELIDRDSLKEFVSKDDFKNKRFAFMNYGLFEKLGA